ncbi:FAD-binding oxidoreductase [Iamia majanohamensis]|uniref:FAD-binding oxidoreductase n=1 Tax=Iamia majanohamensis TaxID=467976 RepID=A0AAE9Y3E1_9ACTN|nr:FAD-binding oxidoreductase [Iamia majanohamensis]WCO65055.1 FAD-binding oxidoreductase [Iamia majanohamensis]
MPEAPALDPRLARALVEVVGADHLLTDPDVTAGAAVDWTGRFRGATPAVVRPGSAAEVAGVVQRCAAEGVALVPQGGNTGLVGGSVPLAGEVVLSSARLAGVGDVDPDGGRITAGAGTSIAAVQAAAAEAGWAYGVDWAARDTATVGGSVATDAGGLHVVAHGSTRAQLLGVEAVLGTGEVLDDLGRLEKDATGYDLSGLLCGSEGTLGVVTAARLRLVPALPDRALAALGFGSWADAVTAVGLLRRGLPGLEAAEAHGAAEAALVAGHLGASPALDPPPAVTLLVGCAGHGDQVDALAAAVDGLAGVTGAAVADDGARRAALWRHRESMTEAISTLGSPHKMDVSLPADALAGFAEEVPARIAAVAPEARTWLFGHLGDGNLHVNVTGVAPDDAAVDDAVLGLVLERRGSISAEHGVGTAKRRWAAEQRGPTAMAAMAAIKAALDPAGILNPAVLL